jgi:hypothetical protein
MQFFIPYWKPRKSEPNVLYIDPIVVSLSVLGHSVFATTYGIGIEPATDDDDEDKEEGGRAMTVGKSYRTYLTPIRSNHPFSGAGNSDDPISDPTPRSHDFRVVGFLCLSGKEF